MNWLEGALWGAVGGFAIEAVDYMIAVRRWRKLPWEVGAPSLNDPKATPAPKSATGNDGSPGVAAYLIAGGLRVAVGFGGAAAITASSGQAMTPWLAFIVGAAVPFMLEKITLFVPFLVGVTREGFKVMQAQAAAERPEQPAATERAVSPEPSPQEGS
ncbi:hypothetical protein SAMN05216489_01887 [Streptomyces sp. 3213]|uniref:hypothetical protein n=1 Tax=Streptomyces sp. 3213.3 TaxID=1855348 RepID=UPI00089BCC0D|nr:hypothetical protein [Streptomyces sp. 3213.3]SEC88886.1 hypothetical protein SAMN05216489_01887 [Streptomyces sp. 3213] [Streptomyces sp. 3213.3]